MTKFRDVHRQIQDIPAKACDDPNLFYKPIAMFQRDYFLIRAAKVYKEKCRKNKTVCVVHQYKDYKRVIRISETQKRCYKLVKTFYETNPGKIVSMIRLVAMYQPATIVNLVKKKLFKHENRKIYLETTYQRIKNG